MTSAPVRDPLSDHLLTPQNAAFLLIDFQPQQLGGVRSMDRDLMVKNAVSTPISWVSLAGELLRDWARPQAAAIAEIVVTDRLSKEQ
jgi:hypothetical protein